MPDTPSGYQSMGQITAAVSPTSFNVNCDPATVYFEQAKRLERRLQRWVLPIFLCDDIVDNILFLAKLSVSVHLHSLIPLSRQWRIQARWKLRELR